MQLHVALHPVTVTVTWLSFASVPLAICHEWQGDAQVNREEQYRAHITECHIPYILIIHLFRKFSIIENLSELPVDGWKSLAWRPFSKIWLKCVFSSPSISHTPSSKEVNTSAYKIKQCNGELTWIKTNGYTIENELEL